MVNPRDTDTLPPDEPGHIPGLGVIFYDLAPGFPVTDAELAAIEWLLGDDLALFLGPNEPHRQS
jgi:hypothetical protein